MTEQGKALLGDGIPDTQIDVREVFGLDIDYSFIISYYLFI